MNAPFPVRNLINLSNRRREFLSDQASTHLCILEMQNYTEIDEIGKVVERYLRDNRTKTLPMPLYYGLELRLNTIISFWVHDPVKYMNIERRGQATPDKQAVIDYGRKQLIYIAQFREVPATKPVVETPDLTPLPPKPAAPTAVAVGNARVNVHPKAKP